MNNSVISIIIPVFNVETYLKRCVDSVIYQTYRDLEIILVNDGSTDNSGFICDEYSSIDKRIKVIHKENGGLSSARNAGIEKSTGIYIWFVDSDDYIVKNAVEILITQIEEKDYEMLLFEGNVICESADMQGVLKDDMYHRKNKYSIMTGAQCLCQHYNNEDYFPSACMYICRRNFIKENNLIFKEGILFEDNLFTLNAYLKSTNIKTISDKLYMRTIRSGSIMRSDSNIKKVASYFIVFDNLNQMLKNEKNQKVKEVLFHISNFVFLCGFGMGAELFADKKIDFNEFKEIIKYKTPIPKKKLNVNKDSIYYGGGYVCKIMLKAVDTEPSHIWDINAEKIGEIGEFKCEKPKLNEVINANIVICIADAKICNKIKKQFKSVGYSDVYLFYEYFYLYYNKDF